MSNLLDRQKILQAKRKQTPWRQFVKEVCSWSPLCYHRNNGYVSVFPHTERVLRIASVQSFAQQRDRMNYLEYDSSDPFFTAFLQLQKSVELPCTRQFGESVNAAYSDTNAHGENLYLTRCSRTCRNVSYSLVVKNTQEVYNSIKVQGGEGNIYMSASVDNSYNIFYAKCIEDSADIWFSSYLCGCSECLFCHDLQNQSYCIENVSYPKEQYYAKKRELLVQREKFADRYAQVPGDSFANTSCQQIGQVIGGTAIHQGRNCIIAGNPVGTENIYDVICVGTLGGYYAAVDCGVNASQIYCSVSIVNSTNIFYSLFLEGCTYCLGCIGLKNKEFCIFNKQYTKESWHQKVDEIFSQMEGSGTLGNFFPGSCNPFYFNDTVAYLIDDSFSKEEVEIEGYLRRDEEIKMDIPEGVEVVNVEELGEYEIMDNGEWKIDSEILKKVIRDKQGNYYRIIPMEYKFLKKHGLPLPRQHWLERLKVNFRVA